MGKLLYVLDDESVIELTIGEGLIVEDYTLKIVNPYVIKSILNSFKLNEMLIS